MHTILKRTVLILFLIALSTAAFAQGAAADKVTVPLSDPSRPAFLKVGLINGSITVKGYAGKDVVVEARVRTENEEENPPERAEKTKGLKRITNTTTGLSVEEENNEVHVGLGRFTGTIDLEIQVPTNTSMKLSTINDGAIEVSKVSGELEASNTNGPIICRDISGSGVVDALNGDITVTFTSVDPKKSMSFSSLNGNIDIAFPPDLKAKLRLTNEQGEIYTDFDMKMENANTKMEENQKSNRGKYQVKVEKTMTGTINGGGQEIQIKNFNGDIYIRTRK